MEGVIVNYRIKYTKEVVVMIPEVKNRRKALKLVGKKVIWIDEKGNECIGKVVAPHGNSGNIRVKFPVPLPPKALGKLVKIENSNE